MATGARRPVHGRCRLPGPRSRARPGRLKEVRDRAREVPEERVLGAVAALESRYRKEL